MKFNGFRLFGALTGAFVWFFFASLLKAPVSYVFSTLGFVTILIGLRSAWRVPDERQGDDPME